MISITGEKRDGNFLLAKRLIFVLDKEKSTREWNPNNETIQTTRDCK